jgi:hypothetical protein
MADTAQDMNCPSFEVKRTFRPGWPVIAILASVLFVGLVAGTLWPGRFTHVFSICGVGVAMASWLVTIAMSSERAGTLSFVDGALRASWLVAPFRPAEVRIGRWVQMSLDTPVGLVAQVRGPGGALRIGVREPLRGTYRLDGPRMQLVDCHLPGPAFEALVESLGVRADVAPPELAIELIARRRPLRTMAPWLIAMASAAVVSIGLSSLGLPQVVIVIAILAIIIAGISATMLDWWRVREPEHDLHVGAQGVALGRPHGGPAPVPVPWREVRAVATTGVLRGRGGTFIYPTMELYLGVEQPIFVGAWDASLAWTDPMKRPRRKPEWLVGSGDWPRLVAALGDHGCFR